MKDEATARADARAEMAQYVEPEKLPAPARWLLARARERGAPPEVLKRLQELDPELEIVDPAALWLALGYEPKMSA